MVVGNVNCVVWWCLVCEFFCQENVVVFDWIIGQFVEVDIVVFFVEWLCLEVECVELCVVVVVCDGFLFGQVYDVCVGVLVVCGFGYDQQVDVQLVECCVVLQVVDYCVGFVGYDYGQWLEVDWVGLVFVEVDEWCDDLFVYCCVVCIGYCVG